jgi:hypothetical protein
MAKELGQYQTLVSAVALAMLIHLARAATAAIMGEGMDISKIPPRSVLGRNATRYDIARAVYFLCLETRILATSSLSFSAARSSESFLADRGLGGQHMRHFGQHAVTLSAGGVCGW